MQQLYKLPLVLDPQPEGGWTITCPLIPELITEADTIEDVQPNVEDAMIAVAEIYEDSGRLLLDVLDPMSPNKRFLLSTVIAVEEDEKQGSG